VKPVSLALVLVLSLFSLQAFGAVSIEPSGVQFPTQPINTASALQSLAVFNQGTATITVQTVTSNLSVFTVVGAKLPVTIAPKAFQIFQVQFTPNLAKSFSGKLTLTFTGAATQTINVLGNGTNPSAILTPSLSSINFGDQALGTNVPTQTLTITNHGTINAHLTQVTVTPPFTQTGWTASTLIGPGKSFTMQIGFSPSNLGLASGMVFLSYDVANQEGVSLWGTAEAATSFGITGYPALPGATQKAAYNAVLSVTGGTAPYTWNLLSGSLPSGLSLSSTGIVSGTVGSTVATGTYTFSATATDSSTPAFNATRTFTVLVGKPTGASCNNISFNAPDGSGPIIPITDLGTNLYGGSESGGLYANGSNQDDPVHDAYGQGLATGIQPLDSNGNPSPTGKYVLLAIGLSVTQQSFLQFIPMVNADPAKNPNLVVVDGGSGGATVSQLTSTTSNSFWEAITNVYLPNSGVTSNQVVAVLFMDTDGGPSGTFPSDMTALQSQMETVAQNILKFFPNVKITYASSMYYMGYSVGVANLDPDPWAYESGFAVKNMIQDQLNGNSNLNFNPTVGTVEAPWLAWGPYLWANGLTPRSDGLAWSCQDLQADGTHPASPGGRIKVSSLILNFFKTDDTASPWFLAPGALPALQ
jgi:hypothetical protein